jgi:gliding motility-associated-like protein
LTAQGDASSYIWNENTPGSSTGSSFTSFISKDTLFSLKGESSKGCFNTATFEVKAKELPKLTYSGNTEICKGGTVTIDVSGASSYEWHDGSVSSRLVKTPLVDTVYRVKGTFNGCVSELEIPVRVNHLPFLYTDGSTEICEGETLRLQVKGAQTYRWSNGSTSDILEIIPLNSTTYTVEGKGANNCVSSISVDVTVNKKPMIQIVGDQNVCENSFVTLTAQGDASSYVWNENTPGSSITSFISKDTLFRLRGESSKGCFSTATFEVKAKELPKLTYSGNTEICKGGTVTIDVSGASSYEWHDGSVSSRLVKTPLVDTVYRVKGTFNGCVSELEIPVRVNHLPFLYTDGSTEICEGETLRLQVKGAQTYRWSNGSTSDILEIIPLNSTTYTVEGKGANNCVSSISVDITVNKKPVIQIVGDRNVCENSSVTLTAQGDASSYVWNENTPGSSFTSFISKDTLFRLRGESSKGCFSTATFEVKMIPLPKLTYSGDTEVCNGDVTTISVSGASSYVWHDGTVSPYYSRRVTRDTTYSVTGSMDGCSTTVPVNIRMKPLPVVQAVGDKEVCANATIRLEGRGAVSYRWNGVEVDVLEEVALVSKVYKLEGTAANGCTGKADVAVTVRRNPVVSIEGPGKVCEKEVIKLKGKGAYSYRWENGMESDSITVNITGTKDYRVLGTDSFGCKGEGLLRVEMTSLPELRIQGDTLVCDGDMATISVSGASSYVWQDGTVSSSYSRRITRDTTYSVTGSMSGCSATVPVNIRMKPLPVVQAVGDKEVCMNETIRLEGSGAASYRWNGVSGDVLEEVARFSKTYELMGIAANGCSRRIQVPVTVRPNPVVEIKGPKEACKDDVVILVGEGADTYRWDNGFNLDSITVRVTETKDYRVLGIDSFGCSTEKVLEVKMIPLPELTIQGETSICKGDMTAISVSGASSYVWHDGTVSPYYSRRVTRDTTYSVTGSMDGCSTTVPVNIRMKPLPVVQAVGDKDVCANETIRLEGRGAVNYRWNGVEVDVLEEVALVSKVYKLEGTAANGCTGKADVAVTVRRNPVVSIEGPGKVCEKEVIKLKGKGAYSYRWENGMESDSITVNITGTKDYRVLGTDSFGCKGEGLLRVEMTSLPELRIQGDTLVCDGDMATISVSGASSYVWQDGTVSSSYSRRITRDTTYSVTGSMSGCSTTIPVNIKMKPLPTIYAAGNKEVCTNATIRLEGRGAVSYRWNGVEVDVLEEVALVSKVYKLEGTAANGCTGKADVAVTVRRNPVVSIEGPGKVCEKEVIKLKGKGAYSYRWENGMESDSITVNITGTKDYRVLGTDSFGCKGEGLLRVEMTSLPELRIQGDTLVCDGDMATISVSGASSYVWQDGTVSSSYSRRITRDTTYSVTGSMSGCSATVPVNIRMKPLPVVQAVGDKEVCMNETIRLEGSGAASYRWNGVSGDVLEEVARFSKTYELMGIAANGCSRRIQVPVTVRPNPVVEIKGPKEACKDDVVILVGEGADTYRWDNGFNLDSITVRVTETKDYRVLGIDSFGCSTEKVLEVKMIPLPELTIQGETSICKGDMTAISVSGASSYVWHDGTVSPYYSRRVTRDTTYSVTGSMDGCSTTVPVNIRMKPLPVVQAVGDKDVCANETIRLEGRGAVNYRWNGVEVDVLEEVALVSKVYKLEGTAANGCTGKADVAVTVRRNPVVSIEGPGKVCEKEVIKLKGKGAYSYRWENGMESDSITVNITGTKDYRVLGTDSFGCKGEGLLRVEMTSLPELRIQGDTLVCDGDMATISVSGASSYVWQDGTVSSSYSRRITRDTTYSVTGSMSGCSTTIPVNIKMKPLPTIYAAGNKEVCTNATIRLEGRGAVSYRWNGVEVDVLEEVALVSKVYKLEGTAANGCTGKADVAVTVRRNPVVSIEGPGKVCEKEVIKLKGKGAYSYRWENGMESDSITVNITGTKDYRVLGTDSFGCKGEGLLRVEMTSLPELRIQGDTLVCDGDMATISVSGASSYVWQDGTVSSSYSRRITRDTTYSVTGSMSGCSTTIPVNIKMKPLPTIHADGSKEVCMDGTIRLEGSGAASYRWNGVSGDVLEEVARFSKTYELMGIAANGCSRRIQVPVTVRPNPVVEIKGPKEACKDDVVILVGEGADTYRWDNGFNLDSITVRVTETKDYRVLGIDSFGCSTEKVLEVKMIPLPELTIQGETSICKGDMTAISVSGASSYVWHDGTVSPYYSRRVTRDTTYSVTGSMDGCSTTVPVNIRMKPLPVVQAVGDKEVCMNETIRLEGSGAASYRWNGVSGDVLEEVARFSKTYELMGIAANGCSRRIQVPVTVRPNPVVEIKGPKEACKDDVVILVGEGADTYRWDNGFNLDSITVQVTETKDYRVLGIDSFGCSTEKVLQVKMIPLPELIIQGETSICEGDMATISASGASSYVWHDGTTSAIYRKQVTESTTYSVTGTMKGCSATMPIDIIMKPMPNIIAIGDDAICAEDTVRLVATGGVNYIWSTGDVTAEMKAAPKIPTKYKLTGFGANGCPQKIDVDVMVYQKPNIKISGDHEVCINSYVNLSVEGDADSYYWSHGSIDRSVSSYITEQTIFTVYGFDQHGCTNTVSHKVDVILPPELDIRGKTTICEGEYVSVSVSGASSYKWHDGSVSNVYRGKPESNTFYTVTGTLKGCSKTENVYINVLPLPSLRVEGDTAICEGDSARLFAYGADTYRWSTGVEEDYVTIVPSVSATYYLQGTDTYGCKNSISVPILVRNKPSVRILVESDEVCINTTAELRVEGDAVSYLWSNGYTGETIRPFMENTTVYTVEGIDIYGCSNKDARKINVIPLPQLSYWGDSLICLGQPYTLMGQGAATYEWSDGSTGPIFQSVALGNTNITMKGTVRNCTSSITIPIMTKIPPSLYITGDSAVCRNTPFTLTVFGAESYQWNTGDETQTISYTPNVSTMYTVTGVGANGCVSHEKAVVRVLPLPQVKLQKDSHNGCPNVADTVVLSASGAKKYTWRSIPYNIDISEVQDTRVVAEINGETLVYVEGVDGNGCEAYDSLYIRELVHPELTFEVNPNWLEDGNSTVRFNGMTPPGSIWYWDPGDGSSEKRGNNITHSYLLSGDIDSFLISVRSIDIEGCEYTGEKAIYIWKDFWAPDAFTPNSDDLNDKFGFFGGDYITEFTYIIYNRLGQIVFTGNSIEDEWNGTYKGSPCPWGVYGWVVQYKSEHKGIPKTGERKGFVTLVR